MQDFKRGTHVKIHDTICIVLASRQDLIDRYQSEGARVTENHVHGVGICDIEDQHKYMHLTIQEIHEHLMNSSGGVLYRRVENLTEVDLDKLNKTMTHKLMKLEEE